MAAINPKLATPTPSRPLPQEPFVLGPYPPLYDNPKREAFPGKDQAGGVRSPRGVAEKTTPTRTHRSRLPGPGPPPLCLPNFGDPPHWLPGRTAPTRDRNPQLKRPASPPPHRAGPARGAHALRLASGPAPAAPGLRPGPRAARCWLPAAAGFVPRADSPSRPPSPRLHPHPTRLDFWRLSIQRWRGTIHRLDFQNKQARTGVLGPVETTQPCFPSLAPGSRVALALQAGVHENAISTTFKFLIDKTEETKVPATQEVHDAARLTHSASGRRWAGVWCC
ncbi:basic proline-rich protein-like [Felis catus]|uniref:basic proline-rich protein-like n=1 Tax=Felis catus TaxID=9685 RepID=UPI001D199219|nr:basic proline-rich protein-like [Felis catus]